MSGLARSPVEGGVAAPAAAARWFDLPRVVLSVALLFAVDFVLKRRGFGALARLLARLRRRSTAPVSVPEEKVARLTACVETALMLYPRRVLCLERSAALVALFRVSGVPADLLLGVQKVPFKAHAWVEVHGTVVNDSPDMRRQYSVIERI